MNAPFRPSTELIALADLSDAAQSAWIEDFVQEHGGSIFQRPQWLRAAEKACGHQASGLVAKRAGQIIGWLPFNIVHSPIFGRALVSSGFGVGGGVLADSHDVADALCRSAQDFAARVSCASVELRGGYIPADWHSDEATNANFSGDLAEDAEAQLLAIPRKQRAEVRKSLKGDLSVTIGRDAQDRRAHYGVYAESVRNLGTPVFPKKLFDVMLDHFADSSDILTVWQGDNPVASVLSFYHAGAVMPYWGGGTFAARGLKANERMYYELMLHARKRGMTQFDFGRSKTGSGPYNYKKNWGFAPQPLVYGTWQTDADKARNVDAQSDAYAGKVALWKKLPLPIANRLGPLIASGLA